MTKNGIKKIISNLNSENVKFLIVGGFAVITYGYLRFTADLDIVIGLKENNIDKALTVLKKLGYYPRLPLQANEFKDPEKRREWIEKKNMLVFSMISDQFPATPLDIFVKEPFDFDKEYRRAYWIKIDDKTKVPVVNIDQLMEMKQTGRQKDRLDIEALKKIKKIRNENDEQN